MQCIFGRLLHFLRFAKDIIQQGLHIHIQVPVLILAFHRAGHLFELRAWHLSRNARAAVGLLRPGSPLRIRRVQRRRPERLPLQKLQLTGCHSKEVCSRDIVTWTLSFPPSSWAPSPAMPCGGSPKKWPSAGRSSHTSGD